MEKIDEKFHAAHEAKRKYLKIQRDEQDMLLRQRVDM